MAETTAKEYRRKMRRFLSAVNKPQNEVTAEDVRRFLKPLADGSPNTYGNALKPLKAFFRGYMRRPEVVASFKFRKIVLRPVVIPSREELQRFYSRLRIFRGWQPTTCRGAERERRVKQNAVPWGSCGERAASLKT